MLKNSLFRSNGTIALISLALGYIVCSLARKESGVLKKIGYIIGIAVIAISSVIILVKIACITRTCPLTPMPVHEMPAEKLP